MQKPKIIEKRSFPKNNGPAKKKKKIKPRLSLPVMIFFYLLMILLAIATFLKVKHFIISHWNKDKERTTFKIEGNLNLIERSEV